MHQHDLLHKTTYTVAYSSIANRISSMWRVDAAGHGTTSWHPFKKHMFGPRFEALPEGSQLLYRFFKPCHHSVLAEALITEESVTEN